MSNHRDVVVAAIVAAGVAVLVTEAIRRLTPQDKEKKRVPHIPKSMFGRTLLRTEFNLRPNYAYANCGSFGHVPQRILEEQIKFIKEREQDPDGWYRFRKGKRYYLEAVRQLAEFIGADPANLVLVENASTGVNTALRSIHFSAGDKILVNTHTYGAVLKLVKQVEADIPDLEVLKFDLKVPLNTEHDVVEQYEKVLNENPMIRVIMLDHITSASALLMPIRPIIDLCHKKGILVIVDGAHAAGQVPLNLEALGADYFTGNLHKWLFAPRGCAFLWVHPKHHDHTSPLTVGHYHFYETLEARFVPSATRDNTAYLSIPAALKFHKALGGLDVILERNRALATDAANMLCTAWGTEVYPAARNLRAPNMVLVALPQILQENFTPEELNADKLMKRLHQKGAFVSISAISGKLWARLSVHVWNSMEEFYVVRDKVIEMKEEVPLIAQIIPE